MLIELIPIPTLFYYLCYLRIVCTAALSMIYNTVISTVFIALFPSTYFIADCSSDFTVCTFVTVDYFIYACFYYFYGDFYVRQWAALRELKNYLFCVNAL